MIGSILFVKSLRQLHHVFIINLAMCDFGVMVMDIFVLIGAFYGEKPFADHPMLCEVCGFICLLSCFGSLWSMMFISINRFQCNTMLCMTGFTYMIGFTKEAFSRTVPHKSF